MLLCILCIYCFATAGGSRLLSDELPLCGEEYLLSYCFVIAGGFRFVSEELPLDSEEYLLCSYTYCAYCFVSAAGFPL